MDQIICRRGQAQRHGLIDWGIGDVMRARPFIADLEGPDGRSTFGAATPSWGTTWPKELGVEIGDWMVVVSAKRRADRAAFNEMLKWVKANARREAIDAILAHRLDQVCRNMRDAVRLQELEEPCGVRLTFVENQLGPAAAGALSFNVMADG